MYDARVGSCVLSVDHGAPVESILMFPTGGLFISAGLMTFLNFEVLYQKYCVCFIMIYVYTYTHTNYFLPNINF